MPDRLKLLSTPMNQLTDDEIRSKWIMTKPSTDTGLLVLMAVVFCVYNLITGKYGDWWYNVVVLVVLAAACWARIRYLRWRASRMNRQEMIDEIKILQDIRRESYP
ncbi:hypothetical protein CYG49_00325 [Candidatus Saccharibacteria bacterium]|nr:MAG: hypothetical protein CYG49_00325 [Candidatus Saccharibacteria bacterium]